MWNATLKQTNSIHLNKYLFPFRMGPEWGMNIQPTHYFKWLSIPFLSYFTTSFFIVRLIRISHSCRFDKTFENKIRKNGPISPSTFTSWISLALVSILYPVNTRIRLFEWRSKKEEDTLELAHIASEWMARQRASLQMCVCVCVCYL